MKKIVLMTALALMIFGCNKDKNSLKGEWKLVAQLMDPGDGSGVFTAVESDKTIEFFKNGNLKSNKNLCFLGTNSTESSEGTYSMADSSIVITTCAGGTAPTIWFSVSDDTLILSYLCFEACAEKYARVD